MNVRTKFHGNPSNTYDNKNTIEYCKPYSLINNSLKPKAANAILILNIVHIYI